MANSFNLWSKQIKYRYLWVPGKSRPGKNFIKSNQRDKANINIGIKL